jgi:hypothetical protein
LTHDYKNDPFFPAADRILERATDIAPEEGSSEQAPWLDDTFDRLAAAFLFARASALGEE